MMTLPVTRRLLKKLFKTRAVYWLYRALGARRRFRFAGRDYPYFYSHYNSTWVNERTVELAIVTDLLERTPGRCLEVGNVLSHYLPVRHDVVDKYEPSPNVINVDVVDYRSPQPYDLIVSISTLEHVGWDEEPRDPQKVGNAVARLKSLLAPGGLLLFTVPLGHNPKLDELLARGELQLTEQRYLQRISLDNRWREVDAPAVRGAAYNRPFFYANALAVGIYRDGGEADRD